MIDKELAEIEARHNQLLERDGDALKDSLYAIVLDYGDRVLNWVDGVPDSQPYEGEESTPTVNDLIKLVQCYSQGIPVLLAEIKRLREWLISEGYALDA